MHWKCKIILNKSVIKTPIKWIWEQWSQNLSGTVLVQDNLFFLFTKHCLLGDVTVKLGVIFQGVTWALLQKTFFHTHFTFTSSTISVSFFTVPILSSLFFLYSKMKNFVGHPFLHVTPFTLMKRNYSKLGVTLFMKSPLIMIN